MTQQGMVALALAVVVVIGVRSADARANETTGKRERRLLACTVDTPSFSVRAYWRSVRSDTSSDNLTERMANGLVDVPVDSIDYVTDEGKCGTALNALNAINQRGDSTTFRRSVTLISWGGVRYIASLGGGGLEHWAVFDSTQAFLWVLTPLDQ